MSGTTFQHWLRETRLRRGLTQEEAAARAEMARSYWNRIETGNIKLPTWDVRQRIHEALGTNEADLGRAGVDVDLLADARAGRAATIDMGEDAIDLNNPLVRAVFMGAQDLTEKGWRMLAAYVRTLQEFEGKGSNLNEEKSPREDDD